MVVGDVKMPMVVGDIISIKDNQVLSGQSLMNVYYYRVKTLIVEGEDYLGDIAQVFWDAVGGSLREVQHGELTHNNLLVENVTNGLEFATYPVLENGSVGSGHCMASFDAYSLKLNRATKLTRNGSKRIAGVPEVAQNNSVIGGDFQALLDILCVALREPIFAEIPGVSEWLLDPVIIGRNPDGTLDLTRVNDIQSVTYKTRITSQVSRKSLT